MNGWLTPEGKFIECRLYQHLEVLAENLELQKYAEDYDLVLCRLRDIEEGCQSNIENGEHPSWHCYEMASDDARYELRDQLLKSGCLRVGSHGTNLHFEGQPDAFTMQAAKDLAESVGMNAIFEKVNL